MKLWHRCTNTPSGDTCNTLWLNLGICWLKATFDRRCWGRVLSRSSARYTILDRCNIVVLKGHPKA